MDPKNISADSSFRSWEPSVEISPIKKDDISEIRSKNILRRDLEERHTINLEERHMSVREYFGQKMAALSDKICEIFSRFLDWLFPVSEPTVLTGQDRRFETLYQLTGTPYQLKEQNKNQPIVTNQTD